MLTFKQFIKEDEKTDNWVQQYSKQDLKRIENISNYLFLRGFLRKNSKYQHVGVDYGTEDLGGGKLTKRKIGIRLRNRKGKREFTLNATPSIERNKKYQERINKQYEYPLDICDRRYC